MSSPAIVTDTSSQLPASLAADLDITVVPIGIVIDGEVRAEPDLDVEAFYDWLSTGGTASTSLPSPGRLEEAYGEVAGRGVTDVISIHLDGRVSGTVPAARLAAEAAPVRVTVIDTRTVSFGVGVCVLAAARAAGAGRTSAEIEALVAELAPAIENVFVAGGSPDGRVGLGAGLSLLSFEDGVARALEPCADLDSAALAMADRVPRQRRLCAAVGYAHSRTAPPADLLARQLRAMPNVTDVLRYRVSPSVGTHTGPRSFGAFWWPQ